MDTAWRYNTHCTVCDICRNHPIPVGRATTQEKVSCFYACGRRNNHHISDAVPRKGIASAIFAGKSVNYRTLCFATAGTTCPEITVDLDGLVES